MNIKELKTIIELLPDDMDVFIKQNNDEYETSMAIDASVSYIRFKGSGIKKSEEPTIRCFLIKDCQ